MVFCSERLNNNVVRGVGTQLLYHLEETTAYAYLYHRKIHSKSTIYTW